MNKILPYIYFIIGVIWTLDAIRVALSPREQYHIFLDYKTPSLISFLTFKFIVAVIFILAGLRRRKMSQE
jgi:hypothetical protein